MGQRAQNRWRQTKFADFALLIPLVLLSLNSRLQYLYFLLSSGKGLPYAHDSQWYIDYARSLMERFAIRPDMDEILYFGYNVTLTALLALLKSPVAVAYVQAVIAGLCVILVYNIARMLFNRTTAVIASLIYSRSWDITLWSAYILADSLFISLLLTCVYLLLKCRESGGRTYKTLFAAASLWLFFFKPTGIIATLFMLVYIALHLPRRAVRQTADKYVLFTGGALAAAAFVGLILAGDRLELLIASMQFNAKKVLYNIYANGWIYDNPSPHDHAFRPDYSITVLNSPILSFIINNWDHILVLYGKRSLAFLGRWVWNIDVHSTVGLIRFVRHSLPLVLFTIGTFAAIANGRFRKASVVWLIVLGVFIFCIIFFIDGMYRYRAPAVPFIAMIVAYGADRSIALSAAVVKKLTGKLLIWNKKNHSW
jgi:4-amino-4-deoxy-L-arabinose transferase-like glycosyltransferase